MASSRSTSMHSCRLRDDVRAKQREVERLEGEVGTLNGSLSTKARALARRLRRLGAAQAARAQGRRWVCAQQGALLLQHGWQGQAVLVQSAERKQEAA